METSKMKIGRWKALVPLLLLGVLSYCSGGPVSELDEQEIIQKAGKSIINEIKKDYYDQQRELYETARGDGSVASKARKEYERRYWLIDALKIEHIEAKQIPTDRRNTVENQDDYIIKVTYSMDNKTPFDGKNERFYELQAPPHSKEWSISRTTRTF